MRIQEISNTQRNEARGRRGRLAALAVTLALVAFVALGSGGAASAAAHPRHPAHPAHPSHPATPAFALDFSPSPQAWSYVNESTGVVSVQTVAGATLALRVTYCGHPISVPSSSGVQADAKGVYVWSWTVPSTSCRLVKATVTAKSGGKTVTKSTTFHVTPVADVTLPQV